MFYEKAVWGRGYTQLEKYRSFIDLQWLKFMIHILELPGCEVARI
jgi:hypothetical protein